jgi:mannose-6-phosphate isomerase-like protein (cupin superfamily)
MLSGIAERSQAVVAASRRGVGVRYPVDVQVAAAMLDGIAHAHVTLDPARLSTAAGAFVTELAARGECEARRAEPEVDCVFFVIAGRARILVRAMDGKFSAGDSFVVRACETYNLSNAGDATLKVLEIQMPVSTARSAGHAGTCSDQGQRGASED